MMVYFTSRVSYLHLVTLFLLEEKVKYIKPLLLVTNLDVRKDTEGLLLLLQAVISDMWMDRILMMITCTAWHPFC
jgi:hypothetical protein